MTAPGAASTGLLTTPEVAAMFRVTPRTVREWARTGWLPPCFRTPGGRRRRGYRRYRRAEVAALLNGTQVVYGRGMS